jgi:hypothetical protein
MNLQIHKNDPNFQIGDTLKLKAWNGNCYVWFDNGILKSEKRTPITVGWCSVGFGLDGKKHEADTITAKITAIWNNKALQDYFRTALLPDDYVVVKIEVQELNTLRSKFPSRKAKKYWRKKDASTSSKATVWQESS